jgi:4-amino-4-deoxy-L-arabinose transferase-like glycosyltransferase
MFRFNNPDALLVLLLVASAYALVRALEAGRTWWLVLAATLIGSGFLTKMFQALLIVPAFAVVYLLAGPPALRRRIGQLLAAGAALVVSSLWWVVAVELVPTSSRPYIGGSTNNSLWNLIFGYNGFGRLTGNETGSVGGGGTTGSRWGVTGFFRLLNSQFGGQVSWLLPAAVILGIACLVVTWRTPRTDHTRSAALLWGGWLLITGAVFSFGRGIIHPYYAVALAPAIGALVGIGAVAMWHRRATWPARAVLSGTVAVTAVWSYILLDRSPGWHPWLRYIELSAGLAIAVLMLSWIHVSRRLSAAVAAAAILVALAGSAAYTLSTVATPHTGAIPSAGPTVVGAFGGPGGGRARGFGGNGGPPAFAGGAPAGAPGFAGGARGGPAGGLLNGSTPSASVTAALQQNSSRYTWVAATVGSNEASGYQLASGKPIMAIGGFNGTDPTPTLIHFEQYVQQGKIHYFIAGGGRGAGPGGGGTTTSTSSQITSWVESHFKSVSSLSSGSTVIYDLTQPVTAN